MTGKYDPDIHHRRSIRLKGYDYSQPGLYSITICVEKKECLFGHVVDGKMVLNEAGQFVRKIWEDLPTRFPSVDLDEYIVMPNHLHGILVLLEVDGIQNPVLGDVIRAFKSISAIGVNKIISRQGKRFWQRNYHERIIRNEKELETKREYIFNNPYRWAEDEENPNRC